MTALVIGEAIIFVRNFAEKRFGLTLKEKPEIKDAGNDQISGEFAVKSFGKNLLFSEYMKDAQIEFRLTQNEHGIFLWDVAISFSFKDGGGNGWKYPTAFMYDNGTFTEKEKQ